MAVGEKMSLFTLTILQRFHMCVWAARVRVKMCSEQLWHSWGVFMFILPSAALPSLFPFVKRVLRVIGILQHCKISIFILIYPFSLHNFFFHPKQGNGSYLPFHPSQRISFKTVLVKALSPALRQQ